jgi:vacuolar protein sorting-associated protein 26
MSFFGKILGSGCTVNINLEGEDKRAKFEVTTPDGKREKFPLYIGDETIKGQVVVTLDGAKKIEHVGIKICLLGIIKSSGNVHEFLSVTKDLEPAGELTSSKTYSFEFEKVERAHESYIGLTGYLSLSYYLRVIISRSLSNITKQVEIWQRNYSKPPENSGSIKMEVGIEDCLHIEFEYNKSKYHLKDVIIGKIYFLLVRLKIKSMNISLIKRETTGSGLEMYNETKTLSKYEIMDGAPVKGEAIPVRLFLGGFELTPSYKDVCGKFSVSYILNLVLVDEDDRRYFKQREIMLWRKAEKRSAEGEVIDQSDAPAIKFEARE